MKHTHTNGHTTTIKMNQTLRQAIAQIRRPAQQAVNACNERISQTFNTEARRGV